MQVEESSDGGSKCDNASSYCGIRNARYPDSRAMGYPFDRPSRDDVATLEQFATPNMIVQDVKIRFTNRLVQKVQHQPVIKKD